MLRQLPVSSDPDLLVGIGTSDDAAVYRLNDDVALVQTVDFFPPIVDDPYVFGEVAAANALSDVYAMGGAPLLALNIVAFPTSLPKDILARILQGGAAKTREAGVLIVGGHTVDDAEPKYGLAVTGTVRPGAQVTNAGARPGDVLVLTKPIGSGVITTAGKQQVVDRLVLDAAVEVMSALNAAAAEAMVRAGVNACVDVTGFGLVGHLREMAEASGVGARVSVGRVPVLDGVRDLLDRGVAPGGTRRNLESTLGAVAWDASLTEEERLLTCDAQTSGGLLISVPEERAGDLLAELKAGGVETRAVVGSVVELSAMPDGSAVEVVR